MILIKEYVSLKTAAMEVGKRHFYSDHSNWLAIFSSGIIEMKVGIIEMKILKILASNYKQFRVYVIFKA